ncbi:hypothetical protein OFY17_04965 [Marinomonas sp. C2222]|uniref:Outer membrane protein beta-barrel domain-containing protein n=1 Tax=Marinomonas sargassi TaxID=2984494 RepID=A0ABT2YQS0_9GAMM|nr:hypothetical protein [Marinomonas sargassi]MCV2402235.1 hypothetical protein [Marinomonas sargassi]
MSINMLSRILLALSILPIGAHAALHFGAGIANYDDEYFHYTDKAYYQNFSMDLGLYSDLDKSHMLYIDAHIYRPLSSSAARIKPIVYAGIGGLFVQDTDNYTHQYSSEVYEENWGLRFPIGIEWMTSSIGLYAEAVPTLILSPNTEYATSTTLGIRYYFY